MTSAQIRDSVIGTARRNPPQGAEWDPNFGFGRVSAREAVNRVMTAAPIASVASNGGGNGASNGGGASAKETTEKAEVVTAEAGLKPAE